MRLSPISLGITRLGGNLFSPARLFGSSEPGVWYDASDLTTMFQDSAGTTAAALESPVGLWLDKSRALAIGTDLVSNGGFATDTVWTKGAGWTIGSGVATKVAGSASALTQTITSTATRWYRLSATITRTAGTLTVSLGTSGTTATFTANSTATFYLLAGSGTQTLSFSGDASFAGTIDNVVAQEISGSHASQSTSASRPVLSARYNLYLNTATLSTQNVTTLAASYTLSFTGTGTITLSGTATGAYSAGTHTITCTAGTLTSTVAGSVTLADLRLTADANAGPAYQRVGAATAGTSLAAGTADYDSVGFNPYLKFDGVDDRMNTAAFGTPIPQPTFYCIGTKFQSLPAGDAHLTDGDATNRQFVVKELTGNFLLTAGTSANTGVAVTTNPSVLSVNMNGASSILRRDGTQVFTGNLGTNTLGQLYIGSNYLGAARPDARIHQIVIRGASTTADQIAATERWLASRSGVTL